MPERLTKPEPGETVAGAVAGDEELGIGVDAGDAVGVFVVDG